MRDLGSLHTVPIGLGMGGAVFSHAGLELLAAPSNKRNDKQKMKPDGHSSGVLMAA
jgi:hypothetical protein